MAEIIYPKNHELVIVSNGMELQVYEKGEAVNGIRHFQFEAGLDHPPVTVVERIHRGNPKKEGGEG